MSGNASAQAGDAERILKAMSDYLTSQKAMMVSFDTNIEVITPISKKVNLRPRVSSCSGDRISFVSVELAAMRILMTSLQQSPKNWEFAASEPEIQPRCRQPPCRPRRTRPVLVDRSVLAIVERYVGPRAAAPVE
jgi:hypothetical protein